MNRRRRLPVLSLLVLVLLVGVPALLTWRAVRQERLDHDLIAAIKRREPSAALAALNAGADPNAPDITEGPLSFWAHLLSFWIGKRKAVGGKPSSQTALALVFDTDPWYQGGHGRPGNEEACLVLALLDKGANPNTCDREGNPVLVTAGSLGYANCVRLLLQHGAEVNAKGADGKTALMVGSDYIEVLRPLLAYGADVEQRDQRGATALHYAARNFSPWTRPESIRALLNKGTDINASDQQGGTALMLSVSEGDVDTSRLLLKAHARLDCRNKAGLTALGLAEQGLQEYPAGNEYWRQIIHLLKQAGAKE